MIETYLSEIVSVLLTAAIGAVVRHFEKRKIKKQLQAKEKN